MRPIVSALIPCWQMAHCVADAVESALEQEDADVEVVVVDDGSTDDPAGALRKFGDRVKLVRQENRGLPAARNAAARAATGEFLAFLDADDRWLPVKTRLQLAAFDASPGAAFAYGQAKGVGDGGWRVSMGKAPEGIAQEGRILVPLLRTGNLIPVLTGIVRRGAFDAVGGFDESLRKGGEDYDFWLRLAERFDAVYVAQPLAVYRLHFDGLYNANVEDWAVNVQRIHDRVDAAHGHDPHVREALVVARSRVLFGRGLNRLQRGDRDGARTDLDEARKCPQFRVEAERYLRRTLVPGPIYRGLTTLRRRLAGVVGR